ncbi:hypothetical protein [Clostridium botulinum]
MEVKIINYLKNNKGGITISEIGGDEKILENICYKCNTNSIEIQGFNEYRKMDKYIVKLNNIINIEEDITNISLFTENKEIIMENWY